jgi:hypothetical protein
MTDTTPTTHPHDPIAPPPEPDECLLCYVARMVAERGCDTTLHWARRWRDLRLPGATGLERDLRAHGGYCDCEIFGNGWMLASELEALDDGEYVAPGDPAPCPGVPSGSSQPCAQWVPVRGDGW